MRTLKITKAIARNLLTLGALAAACSLGVAPASAADDAGIAEAARQGDRAAVRLLVEKKADVNAALADGTTGLHWAAANDDLALVELLLHAGANPRVATRIDAVTPLTLACANGDPTIIAALLRAGADPNAVTSTGVTPLMTAAASGSIAAVGVLLDHGAKVNAQETAHGQTALMFAAAKNRDGVIRLLIRRGADPKLTSNVARLERPRFDEDGNPIGAGTNNAAGRRRTRRNAAGGEGTDADASAGTKEVDGGAKEPNDSASAAALTSEEAPAQRERPASPAVAGNPATRGSASAAAAAALARRASAVVIGGNTALTLAAREGNLEAVRALVEAGADVNEPNAGDKTTPLVTAICNGHYTVANYMLEDGADPNLASVDGLAALYAVIDTQWAPVGWAPNPITGQEKVDYLALMKALLEHGAQPNARLTHKLWFRPTHHDECWIGSAGATPFWRAAQATDIAAMRLLVAHGADPKIPSNEGVNALMVAAGLGWNGNFSTQGPNTALDTVQYCLELGLDPTPQDVQGYTALAGAAYRGDNELVKLLVEKGAKLDARTSRGWSVTDMANGPSLRSSVPVAHPYTVALLLKLGAPALTPVEGEEILGIIRRRPNAPPNPRPLP
jgi:ankyrin repeat protein